MLGAISSFFGGLLSSLRKWADILFVAWWATDRQKKKHAEKVNKVKDKQLEIAARPKLRRDAILKRMFSRKRPK